MELFGREVMLNPRHEGTRSWERRHDEAVGNGQWALSPVARGAKRAHVVWRFDLPSRMCKEAWFRDRTPKAPRRTRLPRGSSRSPREGGVMSKPKTLAACIALTLAVTLPPTAVAGASGAAPASAQPTAALRTAVGPAALVSCKAGTSSGKGDAKFHVCVSSYGNVYSWESPAGWEFINQGNNAEGFGLCGDTGSGWGPIGWDFDQGGASGFGAPTITQPTAGKFPITITRSTGVVKLKQTVHHHAEGRHAHDHGDAHERLGSRDIAADPHPLGGHRRGAQRGRRQLHRPRPVREHGGGSGRPERGQRPAVAGRDDDRPAHRPARREPVLVHRHAERRVCRTTPTAISPGATTDYAVPPLVLPGWVLV